jgi:hypothetical protein
MTVPGWSSYDGIAGTYDSVSVPHYFQRPAERLVALLGISRSDRVLNPGPLRTTIGIRSPGELRDRNEGAVRRRNVLRSASFKSRDDMPPFKLRNKKGDAQAQLGITPLVGRRRISYPGR